MTILRDLPRPGIALITINRPDKLNCIDRATDNLMREAWAWAERNDEVRCIVLTGTKRAFCAGGDIAELLPDIRDRAAVNADDGTFCGLTRVHPTRKPIIAAVNGLAFGGGLELALASDIRIASQEARFGLPEVQVGVLAGAGGASRLPRLVSPALAAEMLLTGEPIDAETALRAGLVSRVVAPDALLDTALAIAGRIAANAPLAIARTLDLIRRSRSLSLADSLDLERASLHELLATADAAEGMAAFTAKRPVRFSGR
ncbi:MAG: enoyl-CoA hydratase/isomerase family protein [Pseudomonadota bacterium]|jgi:enoyl-CoA hydratase/E-phenylitaconyl-CoA hydratase